LSGIALTNGVELINCWSNDGGSNIYVSLATMAIINNAKFYGNSFIDLSIVNTIAYVNGSVFNNGSEGYIYASSSSLTVLNTTFENLRNYSGNGGGIQCHC